MDTLRGGAILLMIFWHATSLPNLHDLHVPAPVLALNEFFLPFRMPTLMFLSGMLLPRSLTKPLLTYYRGKIALVAWPWLVWMVAYRIADGSTWALLHPTTYLGRGYMWFLFFLCVYYAVAPALRAVHPAVPPIVLLAFSLVVQPADGLWHRLVYFAVFFWAGAWLARSGTHLVDRLNRPALLVALGPVAVGLGLASALTDIAYVSWYVPASLAGIVVAIGVTRRLPRGWTRPLRYVGRNSIIYYTAHFPAMVGVLWLALGAGLDVAAVVPLLLATGLTIGTLLARWREVPPVRWLFEMPLVAVSAPAERRAPVAPAS